MRISGKWRVLLLFFVPALLIALLVGAINLHAFYQLQTAYGQSDQDRIQVLKEVATLTDFNQRLAQIQLQMEELLARQASGAITPAELESMSREIGVRLTALDWEFGNRFASLGVTAEIHAALDAAEAQRQIMLEALQQGISNVEQTRAYLQAAREKQQLLTHASNTIIERVTNDLLAVWQQHSHEFERRSLTTVGVGGLTIMVLLLLWLMLILWLSRDLLQLTTALQNLSLPEPELDTLAEVEGIQARHGSLMRPMAKAVLTFRDTIRARQQAEQELRKLSLLVEQDPNAVIVTDLDARIEYVNDAFLAMTGYERDWILGKNPRVLRSGKTPRSTYINLWKQLQQGDNWQGEFINRRRDGSELIEHAIIMPLRQPSGEITHYVAIKRDITKHRQMEAELDRYHRHLEQLVADRTRELNRAKVAAEAANQSKSAFLANVTHELLTPMNVIIGLTHLAREAAHDDRQLQRLDKVKASAQHLLGIIKNLLDLSRLETGQLESAQREIDLQQLLDQVQQQVQPDVDRRGLILSTDLADTPRYLYGDAARIQQVLLNLSQNAVKFTEQGEIWIKARKVAEDSERVRIRFSVSDTGIGIDEEQAARLFQVFEQGDNSSTRRYGGNGLGLALSKRLVELLGGSIGVQSQPDVGSTFWFELPLRTPAGQFSLVEDKG
jgi:PAS domain S-box-containing protein